MERGGMEGGEAQIIPRRKMAEPLNGETIRAVIDTKPEDSNQLKQNDCSASSSSTRNSNTEQSTVNEKKAKSCKGCLYYSSRFKAESQNPLCVGLSRSLSSVPKYIVGESEMEASKEGRSLRDFRYACVGYSLYMDRKGQSPEEKQPQAELPVCVGLEVLVDRGVNTVDSTSSPAHIHHDIHDGNVMPQRPSPKPSNSTGDEFYSRFTRNANLVANGVAKNVRRVGNQIKQSIDDVLYPYRRRPK